MLPCTQHLAQHQYSVGFDGMSGSSHEPVALCSMAFRYPPLWRQGIPTVSIGELGLVDDLLGCQLMWVTIHLVPRWGSPEWEEKEPHFVPCLQSCLSQTYLWKASSLLVLEHLSTLEGKKRDDFFPVFESSGLWKVARCGGKPDLASFKNSNKKTDYVKLQTHTKEGIV